MGEKSSTSPAPVQLPWVKSPDGVFEVYTNAIHITWTVDDLRIRLAQVVDNPDTPNPGEGFRGVLEERAAVTFSWRGAKALRDQLNTAIENFEKANGPIKIDLALPANLP